VQPSAIEFLMKLLETPGPAGSEGAVQEVFLKYTKPHAHEITRSPHGSVAAIRNPKGKPRVIVTGHADEIGLIVHHIDDRGFLYVRGIGGVDLVTLPACVVEVHTGKGVVHGVVGRKPIHLQESDERSKVGKMSSVYVDIGAASKRDAERRVRPGDPITYRRGVLRLGKDLVSSKSLDNRAGLFCAGESFRLLARSAPSACVIALSTVGEEIGGDGAFTASFDLAPDVAVAIDVSFASDQPDVSTKETSEVKLGRGPTICRGPRLNASLVRLFEKAARKARVRLQYEVLENRTGTDGDAIYRVRGGVPMAVVGVPCRYMHSPAEIVSLSDLDGAARMIAAFVKALSPRTSFAPFPE
jgi:endoglucanase